MKNTKPDLIKQYHTLAHKQGMDKEERTAFLYGGWGVTSSTELTGAQLQEACNLLRGEIEKKQHKADQWRKRVIAVIFAVLRLMHRDATTDYVKGIACRAAGYSDFNRIPVSRLRSLYNGFMKEQKTLKNTRAITSAMIDQHAALN